MSCTDENYKEKYFEALERLRNWNYPCHNLRQLQSMKEKVFPELKDTINDKEEILKKGDQDVAELQALYQLGLLTNNERHKQVVELYQYEEESKIGNNIEA